MCADRAGRLIVPRGVGAAMSIYRIEDNGAISYREIPIHAAFEIHCAAIHGDYLFAAGVDWLGKTSRIAALRACNISGNQIEWASISLPRQIDGPSKIIDDLLVLNNELIVLDNLLIPKYVAIFDISRMPEIRLKNALSFCNGTWEEASQIVVGDAWAAILSQSINHGWSAQHISLWSYPQWETVGTVHDSLGGLMQVAQAKESILGGQWSRLAALGKWLLIEAADGLAVLDVHDLLRERPCSEERKLLGRGADLTPHAKRSLRLFPERKATLVGLSAWGRAVLMADPPVVLEEVGL
jgi:hypothetical protein